MVKKVFFKLVVVITGLLLHFSLSAQTSFTLNVATAGTLSTLISSDRKYQITDLTLTGNLNGSDISFISDMDRNGILVNLNLFGANIVNNSIPDNSFKYCGFKTIILPNSVTSIGNSAFYDCMNLTSITIPNGVTSIGDNAFVYCSALTNLIIPNSVTSIGNYAFNLCGSLTNITIGDNVQYIGYNIFDQCRNIESVNIGNCTASINMFTFSYIAMNTSNCCPQKELIVSEQNQKYSTIDGVLFNKDKTALIIFPRGKVGSYTIPNSVSSIQDWTFWQCKGLTSISIPNSITSIGQNAFNGCTGLTNVTIPNSVTSIGTYAFYSTGLTSVTIGNSIISNNITSIDNSAFSGCNITEIYCKSQTPPFYPFSSANINKKTCKLYVPQGSYTAYWLAWGFDNVIETDFTSITPINKDNATIKSIVNGISVETNIQTPISVYNLSGQKVYQSVIDGNTEIPLNKGVYIVNVNNESEKVIVK